MWNLLNENVFSCDSENNCFVNAFKKLLDFFM